MKLKVEQREILYYNKYTYKSTCRVYGAYYTYNTKTIDEYKDRISAFKKENRRYPVNLYRDLEDIDYSSIDKLIKYINKFEKNDKGTLRRENDNVSFFSNDLDFLKKAPSTLRPLKLFQAELMPAGIKYFKREVPALYRVYFKNNMISVELKKDILNYIEKTDGVEGSNALMSWLHRSVRWGNCYTYDKHFINYNDSSNLTMMHILFPEVIGKNYKLEKQ